MTATKDTRKVYNQERIAVNGTFVMFDGKGEADKSVVKFYRLYGDVSLFDEAIQNFCVEHGYQKGYAPNSY